MYRHSQLLHLTSGILGCHTSGTELRTHSYSGLLETQLISSPVLALGSSCTTDNVTSISENCACVDAMKLWSREIATQTEHEVVQNHTLADEGVLCSVICTTIIFHFTFLRSCCVRGARQPAVAC